VPWSLSPREETSVGVSNRTPSIVTNSYTDIGANASAEEAAEELEDGQESVNNVVYSFRLSPTSFDKKSYLTYLKGYMKAIKKKMQDAGKSEEEVTAFEKGAAVAAKKIVANFKDYDFYVGESMAVDGMYV
jgi:hypothetical protein